MLFHVNLLGGDSTFTLTFVFKSSAMIITSHFASNNKHIFCRFLKVFHLWHFFLSTKLRNVILTFGLCVSVCFVQMRVFLEKGMISNQFIEFPENRRDRKYPRGFFCKKYMWNLRGHVFHFNLVSKCDRADNSLYHMVDMRLVSCGNLTSLSLSLQCVWC